MNKISGPLLDRIDIQCEIQAIPFKDLSKAEPGESSAQIRERVMKARAIQTERFKDSKLIHCNAQMTDRMIHQYCELDAETLNRKAQNDLAQAKANYQIALADYQRKTR